MLEKGRQIRIVVNLRIGNNAVEVSAVRLIGQALLTVLEGFKGEMFQPSAEKPLPLRCCFTDGACALGMVLIKGRYACLA